MRRMTEEGGRELVRRRMERNEGEEGEREAVRKGMERKDVKISSLLSAGRHS